jgi:hypothetical protein
LKRTLEVPETKCGIAYFRHGFGRPPASPSARRFIQAWTSSAG